MESTRACDATDQYLVCRADENGDKFWEWSPTRGDSHVRCQENSIPHELLAICHGVNGCYEDEHGAARLRLALPTFGGGAFCGA